MHDRCENPRHRSFDEYGGRGIRVAEEWRGPGGFERFLAHIGPRPSAAHSIDRIDTNGDYAPGNVRWATMPEQQRNRRDTRFFTIGGRTLCLTDWAREHGLRVDTVHQRLKRGWSIEKALSVAVQRGSS